MISPLVSVIIPNYNHARFLDERIQSVLNQTYQNFEVIILDDKSTDNSLEIINKYEDNPHISHIVINEVNSGSPFKQWHKGFELAKGELIWIAESDDSCDFVFLDRCINEYSKCKDLAFVHVTSLLVDADGNAYNLRDISEMIPNDIMDGSLFIAKYMSTENVIWNASAVVFRKDIALNIPNFYQDYKAAGDHLFWVLLAEHGKVAHITDKLNYFRQHQQKVTPAKYRSGITYEEEYRTNRYIKQIGLLSLDKEKEAFYIYIQQILLQNFDSEKTIGRLLKMWRDDDYIKYTRAYCYFKLRRLRDKVIKITHKYI